MRRAQCTWIVFLFSVCVPFAQGQSHVVSSEKLEKLRSVYLKIKAPEEAAGKLHESFAKAAEKQGLLLVDDPHKAASVIDVTLKQKSGENPIYADLIAATLVSRDGGPTTVYTCKLVEDGTRFSTITKKKGVTGLIPVASKGIVFVEEAADKKSKDLVEAVKKEISEAGFQLSATEKDADIVLKDIRLLKKPLRGTTVETRFESKVNAANGRVINLTTNSISYTSIVEPIGPEAENCRSSIEKIAEQGSFSYLEVAETDMALISQLLIR